MRSIMETKNIIKVGRYGALKSQKSKTHSLNLMALTEHVKFCGVIKDGNIMERVCMRNTSNINVPFENLAVIERMS